MRLRFNRFGPLGVIVLLHIALFYSLKTGLTRKPPPAVPHEVIASFITPEPVRETSQPQPAAPKTVPVVKKQATPPKPVPVVNTTPSSKAITAPVGQPATTPAPALPITAATAAPPTPAPPAQPKTISSGVEYLQPPVPQYPAASRRVGEEGKAILRVLVNDKGHAERIDIQKSSGSARLDEAAKQAVLHALFKPYMEDGRAIAVFAIVPITFQLD